MWKLCSCTGPEISLPCAKAYNQTRRHWHVNLPKLIWDGLLLDGYGKDKWWEIKGGGLVVLEWVQGRVCYIHLHAPVINELPKKILQTSASTPSIHWRLQCACLFSARWSIIDASDARPPSPSHTQPVLHSFLHSLPPFFASPSLFHHPTFHLLHPPLTHVVCLPFDRSGWIAARWVALYCKICCVRLAWFVRRIFFSVCGSVWIVGIRDFWSIVFCSFSAFFSVFFKFFIISGCKSVFSIPPTAHWHH